MCKSPFLHENKCFSTVLKDSPSMGVSETEDSVSISSQQYQYHNSLPFKVSRCLRGPLLYLTSLDCAIYCKNFTN